MACLPAAGNSKLQEMSILSAGAQVKQLVEFQLVTFLNARTFS